MRGSCLWVSCQENLGELGPKNRVAGKENCWGGVQHGGRQRRKHNWPLRILLGPLRLAMYLHPYLPISTSLMQPLPLARHCACVLLFDLYSIP